MPQPMLECLESEEWSGYVPVSSLAWLWLSSYLSGFCMLTSRPDEANLVTMMCWSTICNYILSVRSYCLYDCLFPAVCLVWLDTRISNKSGSLYLLRSICVEMIQLFEFSCLMATCCMMISRMMEFSVILHADENELILIYYGFHWQTSQ